MSVLIKGMEMPTSCGFCRLRHADAFYGDAIRDMTDEELAIEMTAKGGCPHDCEEPENMDTDCVKCWLKWLRQAAEEGE